MANIIINEKTRKAMSVFLKSDYERTDKAFAKSAGGSALTQSKGKVVTGTKAASAASRILNDPKASKSAKSLAASALTQKKR